MTTQAPPPPPPISIHVKPTGRGLFDAFDAAGRLLVTFSRTPFFSSARVLASEGVDPSANIQMVSVDGMPSLFSTVGRAAGLTVAEDNHRGLRVVKWRPTRFNTLTIPGTQ